MKIEYTFYVLLILVSLAIVYYIINNGSEKTCEKNVNIYKVTKFNNVEEELKNFEKNRELCEKTTHINAIKNSDTFVSKMGIHKLLKIYYKNDNQMINNIIPKTWNISNDIIKELKDEKSDTVFIAKKNIQQQKGILLFRKIQLTKNFIEKLNSEKYVVIQEYLRNPFLIDQRKTNIRVYMLMIKKDDDSLKIYIYNDGFMYYTPEKYSYGTDKDSNITTGYIDRSVYEKNPLTLKDLKKYLEEKKYDQDILFDNIDRTIKNVMSGCTQRLLPIKNVISFQLFGVDLQFDNKLNVKLIEINKSPNLKSHDTGRDSELKEQLQDDIIKIVKEEDCKNFKEI
jgi:hypothetical protein